MRTAHSLPLLLLLLLSPGYSQAGGQTPEPTTIHKATFAGGCFWCMEPPFDKLPGVLSTISGYSGGHTPNPDYRAISTGGTGHAEVVQIEYDPRLIRYEQLLAVFWRNIDPLTPNRQFCDNGNQYRSEIFYHDETQRRLAEASLRTLRESNTLQGEIVTRISPLKNFYPAEAYHQDYYQRNPLRYKFYRLRCGRDKRLKELWGE